MATAIWKEEDEALHLSMEQRLKGLKCEDPERRSMLGDIGFTWNVHDSKWQIKFNQLKADSEENGH